MEPCDQDFSSCDDVGTEPPIMKAGMRFSPLFGPERGAGARYGAALPASRNGFKALFAGKSARGTRGKLTGHGKDERILDQISRLQQACRERGQVLGNLLRCILIFCQISMWFPAETIKYK